MGCTAARTTGGGAGTRGLDASRRLAGGCAKYQISRAQGSSPSDAGRCGRRNHVPRCPSASPRTGESTSEPQLWSRARHTRVATSHCSSEKVQTDGGGPLQDGPAGRRVPSERGPLGSQALAPCCDGARPRGLRPALHKKLMDKKEGGASQTRASPPDTCSTSPSNHHQKVPTLVPTKPNLPDLGGVPCAPRAPVSKNLMVTATVLTL